MALAQRDPIVIAASSDERYAPGLAVTIFSLLRNIHPSQEILLYILSDRLLQETRDKLLRSWSHNHLTVLFIDPDVHSVKHLNHNDEVSSAVYFRLLLPDLLPHQDKVLYLDSDIVVCADVSELWRTDLCGYPLAAVQDMGAPFVSNTYGLPDFQEIGLDPRTPYCNSGVLLMDLKQWREQSIGRSIMEYSAQHKDIIRYWDQDGINAVLANKWLPLPPNWNHTIDALLALGWWHPSCPEEQNMLIQRQNTPPSIIHFVTTFKPWMSKCRHPQKPIFERYLRQTAWSTLVNPVKITVHA